MSSYIEVTCRIFFQFPMFPGSRDVPCVLRCPRCPPSLRACARCGPWAWPPSCCRCPRPLCPRCPGLTSPAPCSPGSLASPRPRPLVRTSGLGVPAPARCPGVSVARTTPASACPATTSTRWIIQTVVTTSILLIEFLNQTLNCIYQSFWESNGNLNI